MSGSESYLDIATKASEILYAFHFDASTTKADAIINAHLQTPAINHYAGGSFVWLAKVGAFEFQSFQFLLVLHTEQMN